MTARSWTYPPELVAALERFGFRPAAGTPPALVREALHDQYRYQLRRVRDDLRAGRVARPEYLARVVALRKQYWPLTLQLPAWEKICSEEG
jgi:hypothetical protein